MKTLLLKTKEFLKRNIYPVTVSACTILVLGIITISAFNSIKASKTINTSFQAEQTIVVDDKEQKDIPVTPTSGTETIIFDLPFENATISKEYTDSSLIYDQTTKLWCTHQGLDFACIEGQMVRAVFDGKITKVENSMMNGTVVYLEISDNLTVIYKGLSSDVKVKEGDKIKKGALIGNVTSFLTEKADGVHLHLELKKQEKLIDPTEYFSFNK